MTERELIKIPGRSSIIMVGSPSFGPSSYRNNRTEMKNYSYPNPITGMENSLRPAKIYESILTIAHNLENISKLEILSRRWLQAGPIVKTKDGIFTNTTETDENILKELLKNSKEIEGVCCLGHGKGFISYEDFEQDIHELGNFSKSKLAKTLEFTPAPIAKNLQSIVSPKLGLKGIKIVGFDPVIKPSLRILGFEFSENCFLIDGSPEECDNNGHAFGILDYFE